MALFLAFQISILILSISRVNATTDTTEIIKGDLETLLSETNVFEVIGDLTPLTMYIPKVLLRERLGKDFDRWICNPDQQSSCMTNRLSIPDNQLSDFHGRDVDHKRKKRYIGAIIAGILGIGGIIDAEYTRHRLNNEVKRLDKDIFSLNTGLHEIGHELLAHIKLDQKWREDMGYYVHDQFSQQHEFNSRVVQDVQNLYRQINDTWDITRMRLEDTRRRIINLAKLSSMSITRLADEISMVDSLVDAMLWQSLLEGKFPRWAMEVPAFNSALKNVSRQLEGFDTQEGWMMFCEVFLSREWTILQVDEKGMLIGSLIPSRKNVGMVTTMHVPPYCAPGDDGLMYTVDLKERVVKLQYQGQIIFTGEEYLSACDKDGRVMACPDPKGFPVKRASRLCSSSLFKQGQVIGCNVLVSTCPTGYAVHRTKRTLMVSGKLRMKVDEKIVYQGDHVSFLIPLVSSATTRFETLEGSIIATVHKSISSLIISPTAVSFSGDWVFPDFEPWNGVEKMSSVLKIPQFSEPPKFDEGELMVQIQQSLEQPGNEIKAHAAEMSSEMSTSNIWLICVLTVIGIMILAIGIMACLLRRSYRKRHQVTHSVGV